MPFTHPRVVAIGDPQASRARFMAVLEANALLGPNGRLAHDVHLVSMGDHFDWGAPSERAQATSDGLETLSWLASHPPEQVTLLLGNHDLARVCELAPFTDETFAEAQALANAAYRDPAAEQLEAELLARWPSVPDAECLARDYSCFSVAQRRLVRELLVEGRFRLATEHAGVLLVHAGVTRDDLQAVGIDASSDASAVAARLNLLLTQRVASWDAEAPLDLTPLHQPGSAEHGEGRGAPYHRPADPATQPPERFAGPPRRRFDPRRLPGHFPQVIGHIRDSKCRELMPRWLVDEVAHEGALRTLTISGEDVQYRSACAPGARLYFVDNGMSHVPAEAYELLDLRAMRPLVR